MHFGDHKQLMEHYVTHFDSNYFLKGLALYRSLVKHAGPFKLWIVCMDEITAAMLERLKAQEIEVIRLPDIEFPALLELKNTRTWAEYCWTVTPFLFDAIFSRDLSASRVTYLDSDIWFRKSPQLLLDELDQSNKKVLITDHGYSPELDQSATSGQYCVQFVTFARKGAEALLRQWQGQCLDWCFNRSEDGKFGDQKYLDLWPEDFPNVVHVLERQDRTLAPWNALRFPYGNAVFWHFHLLKIKSDLKAGKFSIESEAGQYIIPKVARDQVYANYINELEISAKYAQALI